jgi:hypothetical protein
MRQEIRKKKGRKRHQPEARQIVHGGKNPRTDWRRDATFISVPSMTCMTNHATDKKTGKKMEKKISPTEESDSINGLSLRSPAWQSLAIRGSVQSLFCVVNCRSGRWFQRVESKGLKHIGRRISRGLDGVDGEKICGNRRARVSSVCSFYDCTITQQGAW